MAQIEFNLPTQPLQGRLTRLGAMNLHRVIQLRKDVTHAIEKQRVVIG